MQSVFDGHRGRFDVVYDLKGATHKRWAKDKESVRKDVDWLNDGRCLNLSLADKERLHKIHVRDSEFLKSCNVMDYSMLVGTNTTFPGTRSISTRVGIPHFAVHHLCSMIEA